MKRFQDILFVSRGIGDEADALRLAMRLSVDNQARLTILIVHPGFPENLLAYQETYEAALANRMRESLQTISLPPAPNVPARTDHPVEIEFERGNSPAVRITRHVIREGYDLVIKMADTLAEARGFKALDMD